MYLSGGSLYLHVSTKQVVFYFSELTENLISKVTQFKVLKVYSSNTLWIQDANRAKSAINQKSFRCQMIHFAYNIGEIQMTNSVWLSRNVRRREKTNRNIFFLPHRMMAYIELKFYGFIIWIQLLNVHICLIFFKIIFFVKL